MANIDHLMMIIVFLSSLSFAVGFIVKLSSRETDISIKTNISSGQREKCKSLPYRGTQLIGPPQTEIVTIKSSHCLESTKWPLCTPKIGHFDPPPLQVRIMTSFLQQTCLYYVLFEQTTPSPLILWMALK